MLHAFVHFKQIHYILKILTAVSMLNFHKILLGPQWHNNWKLSKICNWTLIFKHEYGFGAALGYVILMIFFESWALMF